jgi:hypothetical protein
MILLSRIGHIDGLFLGLFRLDGPRIKQLTLANQTPPGCNDQGLLFQDFGDAKS